MHFFWIIELSSINFCKSEILQEFRLCEITITTFTSYHHNQIFISQASTTGILFVYYSETLDYEVYLCLLFLCFSKFPLEYEA